MSYSQIVQVGIERGLIHLPVKPVQKPKFNHPAYMRKWRADRAARFDALGLTHDGTPRKRNAPEPLSGLTPEQKRERRRQQTRAWKERRKGGLTKRVQEA